MLPIPARPIPETVLLQETEPPAGDQAPRGNPFGGMWVPLILIFAVFYFVMIGPERKQRKKREAMLAAMKKGDRVMTTGGMYGTIAAIQDDVVTLQLAEGVRVRFARVAVQTILSEEAAGEPSKG